MQNSRVNGQIKSKQRVAKYGEVFTAEREVNSMLDMVKHEAERVESRFLEPACGNGNFLVEILRRKLRSAKRQAENSAEPFGYERLSIIAVASIYGIELLYDNVAACRERLYEIWNAAYKAVYGKEANTDCQAVVREILDRNIVCGNTLSRKMADEFGNDTDEPIVFSEWFFEGEELHRQDSPF